jgi:polyisoprenoid-binding protein YceI
MDTAKASPVHFVVDARSSRFTVQAFATGLLSAMGHSPVIGIRTLSGEVDFDAAALQASGFRLSINANSLSVLDDVSDKDRREIERMMNEQVLEVAKFPEILYQAPSITITKQGEALYSAVLNGSLSLHGVTQNQQLTARVAVFGEMLRASGEFRLRQSDYAIKPISVAGGALKVKDELMFSFEIVARQQQ